MAIHSVCYAWLEQSKEKRARTVVDGPTRHAAKRKFQRQNPHVLVVADERVSNDPSFVSNLAAILAQRQAICA